MPAAAETFIPTAASVPEAGRVLAFPLGPREADYIDVLGRQAYGLVIFRTGAGRIFRDLMLHWPTLPAWEDEAYELCERIADAIYPLSNALFAQAVEITLAFSPSAIDAPQQIDGLSTYVVFDPVAKSERRYFLSPTLPLPQDMMLPCGVAVLCRPFHYRYHTIKDDRERKAHPRVGLFEWPERLINQMLYEQPDFVPGEKKLIAAFGAKLAALPKQLEKEDVRRVAALTYPRATEPTVARLPTTTSLSPLPPAVRALERRLMAVATDRKTRSAALRLGVRRVAQSLRASFPPALIDEAALRQTKALRQTPHAAPQATPPATQLAARQAPRENLPAVTARPVPLAVHIDQMRKEFNLPPQVARLIAIPPQAAYTPPSLQPQSVRPSIVSERPTAPRADSSPAAKEAPRAEAKAAPKSEDNPKTEPQKEKPTSEKNEATARDEPKAQTKPQKSERPEPSQTPRQTPTETARDQRRVESAPAATHGAPSPYFTASEVTERLPAAARSAPDAKLRIVPTPPLSIEGKNLPQSAPSEMTGRLGKPSLEARPRPRTRIAFETPSPTLLPMTHVYRGKK